MAHASVERIYHHLLKNPKGLVKIDLAHKGKDHVSFD